MFHTHIHPGRILLRHTGQAEAEIYPFGALLNAYAICRADGSLFNCIDGYPSPAAAPHHIRDRFQSAKLSPFACRIRHAAYRFAGQDYTDIGTFRVAGHSAHGLLYDAVFRITAGGSDNLAAWVELAHDYPGSAGYPFPYRLTVRYALSEQGLSVQSRADNLGTAALPIVDGWHPYFTLGGSADNWTLALNSRERLVFDHDLVPNGQTIADERFTAPARLAGIELDNSFMLADTMQAACRLNGNGLALEIFAEQNYPIMQVYLPDERNSIALENLSGAPDAFNNGIGLHTLAPGQSQTFALRYQLSEVR